MKNAVEQEETLTEERPEPRVVYTSAPVVLGTLVAEREGEGFEVRIGARTEVLSAAADVSPAWLRQLTERQGRVIVDTTVQPPVIAGALTTQQPVVVDDEGDVALHVRRFVVRARDEARLQSTRAFVRVQTDGVELYAERVLTRARRVAKILARMIELN